MTKAAEIPKVGKFPDPSVEVQDAWDSIFTVGQGVQQLLAIGADSDEGHSPEACQALAHVCGFFLPA
jgi:hypothetical protein